jgi:4-amino-4-deoxy-L-arabinose transferase-like glycosyltransferase
MKTRTLYIILLVAVLIRGGLLASLWKNGEHRIYTPDSQAYIQLSHSLVEQGTFQREGEPEIFRTPGYPLLLAFSIPWGESWWQAVLVFQVILDVVLVYLTFLLGWMLAGDRAGLIAAALQAVEPLVVASSLRILSDSLYAFLFILAILLLVHCVRHGRWWALIASALVLGAACYVRPVGGVMAAVAAVMLLLVGGERRLLKAVAMAGIVGLCAAPWVVRNVIVADYRGFSTQNTDAMYYFAAPEVLAATEGISPDKARAMMAETDEVVNAGKSPGQAADARRREAIRILSENPWLYARIHLVGCLGVFLPAATDVLQTVGLTTGERGTLDVLHTQGIVAAVRHYFGGHPTAMMVAAPLLIATAVQYLGALLCIIQAGRQRIPKEVWLLVVLVVVSVLLPGPFGLPRYRLPITPLLCVAAGAGMAALRRPAETDDEKAEE